MPVMASLMIWLELCYGFSELPIRSMRMMRSSNSVSVFTFARSGGDGVPKDHVQAATRMVPARCRASQADLEEAPSQASFKFRVCFHKGDSEGVPKVQAQAVPVMWYRKAADACHMQAQIELALCYMTGDGVPRDSVLVASLFCPAAEACNIAGLAHLFSSGDGIPKDLAQTAVWLRRVAAAGHVDPQQFLNMVLVAP